MVKYIQSEFASDRKKADCLLEQLENNPLVESVCSVPLNCAIVCHLWRTLREALPTTMTELYTKITLKLIFRNIRKIDTYNSLLSLPKFDSLPADLQQPWWLLCEFAFQALEKDQLVFSQEELLNFFPKGLAYEKIIYFGLLQSTETILDIGYGVSFNFLHLIFQEYLAALHLARQSPDKQLKVFMSHELGTFFSPSRYAIVWKFFFGINCFLDLNIHVDTSCFIQQIFECVADLDGLGIQLGTLSVCHCAFEAQSDLINIELAQFLVGLRPFLPDIKVDFGNLYTAHDCTAVLYVMANMQKCDAIAIGFDYCDITKNQIKNFIDILASKKEALQVVDLSIRYNRLTVSSLQALGGAICDDLFSKLKRLNLMGSLTSNTDTNATFVEALSAHCPYLEHLNLSYNNLGVPGASVIPRIYESSNDGSTGIILCLNKTNLGDKGLIALIENLEVVSRLELAGNHIHAIGVSCLADAICIEKVNVVADIQSILDLSDNPLGLKGTVAFGRMISSKHFQLNTVDLSKCDLTTCTAGGGLPNTHSLNIGNRTLNSDHEAVREVGQQLCQMPQSNTIASLILDSNNFTGVGIHILAGFLHLCPCLIILCTRNCGITSDDLIRLLDKLTNFKTSSPSVLRSWSLCYNQIDDNGVSALMDHLQSLFHLGIYNIHLDKNPASNEMMKRLKEEFKLKRTERVSCSVSSTIP